jgi:GINS complex subunit 4
MDTLDIFDNSTGDADQFEEELTAAEVLQKLEDAWLNEKHSPELLEPRMEIVECMLEQVVSGLRFIYNRVE